MGYKGLTTSHVLVVSGHRLEVCDANTGPIFW